MDLAELVEPTAVVLKLNELADRVTGAVPVPVRLTVWGLLIALSAKLRFPVTAPSAERAPLRVIIQAGMELRLDASGTRDPDGQALQFHWSSYAETSRGAAAAVPLNLEAPDAALRAKAIAEWEGWLHREAVTIADAWSQAEAG